MTRGVVLCSLWLAGNACQRVEPPASGPAPSPGERTPVASASPAAPASGEARPERSSLAAGSWGLSPPPAHPLDQLLGRTRDDVEVAVGSSAQSDALGWARYGETWALRYEDGCAVELRCELPVAVRDCHQAAVLTGYANCPGATRNARICLWPERFVSAEFDPDSGIFRVQLLREGRACVSTGVP